MTVQSFTFNPFMTNGYVLYGAGEAVLVDAPSTRAAEHRQVLDYLKEHGLSVRHLLLTHAHNDHIFGCRFFAEHFGLSWQLHPADTLLIERAVEQAQAFGVQLDAPPAPETTLAAGDTVAFGGVTLEVLHTPGHSPGSVSFVDRAGAQVAAGDVLFKGSIGRTQDLPQTSLPLLLHSINDELLPLGDDMTVYPGHGPATTLGQERRTNPFLTEDFAAQVES